MPFAYLAAVPIVLAFFYLRRLLRASKTNIPLVTATWYDQIFGDSPPGMVVAIRGYSEHCRERRRSYRASKDRVVIPPVLFKEAMKLPTHVLSASHAFDDMLHLQYTLGRDIGGTPPFVRRDMAPALSAILPDLAEEVAIAWKSQLFPDGASADGSANEVNLIRAVSAVVSQVTCSVLLGKDLARSERFVQRASSLVHKLAVVSVVLDYTPECLRKLVVSLSGFYRGKDELKQDTLDTVAPVVSAALRDCNGPSSRETPVMLQALVKMLVAGLRSASGQAGISEGQVLEAVTNHLVALMFAAFDTTMLTATHAVMDLLSQDPVACMIPMRDEASIQLALGGGGWTMKSLANLKLTESFVHESQRLRPIGLSLGARTVMAPDGYTFSNGDHVPFGFTVTVPAYALHHDEDIFAAAETFDLTRSLKDGNASSIAGRDQFLSFGYGAHACPGRSIALSMVKLMLAEILLKYEVQPLAVRPRSRILGNYIVPDTKTTILVRAMTACQAR